MFHQHNGEKSMVEGVMMDVNFSVQRPRQKNGMTNVRRLQYLSLMNFKMHILLLHHFLKYQLWQLDVSMGIYCVQVLQKKTSPLQRFNRVKYMLQEEFS